MSSFWLKLNELILNWQFKFLAILPADWQHSLIQLVTHDVREPHMQNTKASAKAENHALHAVGHSISNGIHDVVSGIASTVDKLLLSMFWSSGIGHWLEKNSMASTVFCVDPKNPNSTAHLEHIINTQPFAMIYNNNVIGGSTNTISIITTAIQRIQAIFIVLMVAIFVTAFIVAGLKLADSSILNSSEKRQDFLQMTFRTFIAFFVLDFLPQILCLLLQFAGVITLGIQQAMMTIPVSSKLTATSIGDYAGQFFHGKLSLWAVAYSMGANASSISGIIGHFGGFFFILAYILVNIGTALWLKFFYVWREVSFIILLLLAYIQIPLFAFNSSKNRLGRWCNSMFSVIFIQPINALVIMFMAVLWSCGLMQLDKTHTLGTSFGTMIFMLIVLTTFQPLTKVIASQLDLNSGMVSTLTSNSSSVLKTAGDIATGVAIGTALAGAGAIAGGAKMAGGMAQAGSGIVDRLKAQAQMRKNNSKNPRQQFNASLAMQRRMRQANGKIKKGFGNMFKGTGTTAKGMLGGLGVALPPESAGLLMSAGGEEIGGVYRTPTLQRLSNTLAGGVIGSKVAQKLHNWKQKKGGVRSLGFTTLANRIKHLFGHNTTTKGNNAQETTVGKRDNANHLQKEDITMNNARKTGSNKALSKSNQDFVNNSQSQNDNGELATTDVTQLRKYANDVSKSAKNSGFIPNPPSIRGTESTPASRAFFHNMRKIAKNPNASTRQERHQGYSAEDTQKMWDNYCKSPSAITEAMDEALQANGMTDQTVRQNASMPTKAVLDRFQNNLQDLGYSEDEAKTMASPRGFLEAITPNDQNIDNNWQHLNNVKDFAQKQSTSTNDTTASLASNQAGNHTVTSGTTPVNANNGYQQTNKGGTTTTSVGNRVINKTGANGAKLANVNNGYEQISKANSTSSTTASPAGNSTINHTVGGTNATTNQVNSSVVAGGTNQPNASNINNNYACLNDSKAPLMNGNFATSPVSVAPANEANIINANQPFNNSPAEMRTQLSPSYLAQHLAKDDNGNIKNGAIMAHIGNNSSYITANMQDGTPQVISSFNQGDPQLQSNQEFCQPLNLNSSGKLSGVDLDGNALTGTLLTDNQPKAMNYMNNGYVSKLVSDYNGAKHSGYQHYNQVASPISPLVDRGTYTLQHVKATPNLSDFMINANNGVSYLTCFDKAKNQRVRLSTVHGGISGLSPTTNVAIPVNFDNSGLHLAGTHPIMNTTNNQSVSQHDFNDTLKWTHHLNLNNYIRHTTFNPNNYLKGHEGNYNIDLVDFMTDD